MKLILCTTLCTIFFSAIPEVGIDTKAFQKEKTVQVALDQYSFKLGLWRSKYKTMVSRDKWENGISDGSHFYLSKDTSYYVEEVMSNNKIKAMITYKYNATKSHWDLEYTDQNNGDLVNYTAKLINGNMVETIFRNGSVNNNTYRIINDSTYTYTAVRTLGNGYSFSNHIATHFKL